MIMVSNIDDKRIIEFNKKGYLNLGINFENEIKDLLQNSYLNIKDKNRIYFETQESKKIEFIKKIEIHFKDLFESLSRYYRANVKVVNCRYFRIENEKNIKINKKLELYSNFYHKDAYIMTYNKLFINLMDIKKSDGPTHFIPKNKSKEFIKKFKYNNRNSYTSINDDEKEMINIGKFGNTLLLSTTECFHRASVPKDKRDMMIITLGALPIKDSDYNRQFRKNLNSHPRENSFIQLMKPKNFFDILKLLYSHLKFANQKKSFKSI